MEFNKLTEAEYRSLPNDAMEYEGSAYAQTLPADAFAFLSNCSDNVYDGYFQGFYWQLSSDRYLVARNKNNPEFARVLHRLYEHMIACGDAGACCNLANMYHDTSNQGMPEDYARAIELYNLGADRGDAQSMINLAYIYYYGRGVERDYARAYELYARAALVSGEAEAYWKLGDFYAGGKFVSQSDWIAYNCYHTAYEQAGTSPLRARGAHHVADYLMSGIPDKLEADPDAALRLYNEAELCYYELIDSGLSYYQRQLDQCIEAQARAREAVQERHRRIRSGEEEWPEPVVRQD